MSSIFEQFQSESEQLSRKIGEKRAAQRAEAQETLTKAGSTCRSLLSMSNAMLGADRIDEASVANNLVSDIASQSLFLERTLSEYPIGDRYMEFYDKLKSLLEQAEELLSGSE